MPESIRQTLAAERCGPDLFLTAHFPLETPLSLAAQKAAQLHGLLLMLNDRAIGDGSLGAFAPGIPFDMLSLAAELAHETLVFSEMAVRHVPESTGNE